MKQRILVTGSRSWTDEATIHNALWEQLQRLGPYASVSSTPVLVHGGARGADEIAAAVWHVMWGLQYERHPVEKADWDRLGKRAGIIRNQHMVDLGADVCLAFIKDGSRGASHCATAAEKAGIPTIRFV